MKNLLITCLIVALLVAGNAFGAQFTWWNNSSGDGDWMNAANWSNGVPGLSSGGSVEKIPLVMGTPNVGAATMSGGVIPTARWISIGDTVPGQYTVEMRGDATHTSIQALYMQSAFADVPASAVSNFNMYDTSHYYLTQDEGGYGAYLQTGQGTGGTSNVRLYNSSQLMALYNGLTFGDNRNIGSLYLNDSSRIDTKYVCLGGFGTYGGLGSGSLYVSGNAQLNIAEEFVLAPNDGTTATINLSGGVINVGNAMVRNGTGSITVSGGEFNILASIWGSGQLGISELADGGTITVSGGTVRADSLFLDVFAMSSPMTVSGTGMVILSGDQMALVQSYIDNGALTVGAYYLSGGNTYLVPEPASMLLLGLGSLIFVRRNRK